MRLTKQRVPGVVIALLLFTAIAPAQVPQLDGNAILETIRTLASAEFEGRRTGERGGLKARAWVRDRFKTIGLAPLDGSYQQTFSFRRNDVDYKDAANIVGMCRGTSGAAPALVVTAHYDHVGVRDGAIYHGADDNASGVAVMLALAAECVRQPFRHDTLFVAFDAEELGLQGARAFVANPPIDKERIALNVNLDMVSRSSTSELFVAGTYHWPATKPLLAAVAKRAPLALRFGHDRPKDESGGQDNWTNQSDHAAFHAEGIPFVFFGVEDHPDYHKPSDTADKIDPVFLGRAATTIFDAVVTLNAALPLAR